MGPRPQKLSKFREVQRCPYFKSVLISEVSFRRGSSTQFLLALLYFINVIAVEMRVVYEPGQSAFCPSETVTAECSSSTACSTLQIESGALGGEIASISTAESVNFSLLKGGCFIILTHKTTEGVTVSIECVPTTKSINFTCGDALNRSVSSTVTAIAASEYVICIFHGY